MTDRESRRARWEGFIQTAVFIGALLVLVAVLYASAVVQHSQQEAAQRLETAQAAATVAHKAAPAVTVPAYPAPRQASTLTAYPMPDRAATLSAYPQPDSRSAPGSAPLPAPTDDAP